MELLVVDNYNKSKKPTSIQNAHKKIYIKLEKLIKCKNHIERKGATDRSKQSLKTARQHPQVKKKVSKYTDICCYL